MPKWATACKGIRFTDSGICPKNKIPTLSRDNYEIWGLFSLMLPGLMRMEGYDYNAIKIVFDIHEIEQARRPQFFKSITSLIDIISAEHRARADNKK